MGQIFRAMAAEDQMKISVISAPDIVERARQIHNTSPTASAALGRVLLGTSLLGNMLKSESDTLTVRIAGDGPVGRLVAVSDSAGNVRGYADQPQADLPTRADGKLDVGGLVGHQGLLTVSRDLGLAQPYIGSVELVSGEVAEDFAAYLVQSEQIGAAVGLGVLVDTDKTIRAAGGFVLSLLPGAPAALLQQLEGNIAALPALTDMLDQGGGEAVLDRILAGLSYHIVGTDPVAYRCYCSRERFARGLQSLDRKSLQELVDAQPSVECQCQFCNSVYVFDRTELLTWLHSELTPPPHPESVEFVCD